MGVPPFSHGAPRPSVISAINSPAPSSSVSGGGHPAPGGAVGASHQGLLCAPPPGRGDRGPRGGQELGPPPALLLPVDLHVGVAALDLGEDSGGKWGRSGGLGGAAPSVPPPSTLCAPPRAPQSPSAPLPSPHTCRRACRGSGSRGLRVASGTERGGRRGVPSAPQNRGGGCHRCPPSTMGGGSPTPPTLYLPLRPSQP